MSTYREVAAEEKAGFTPQIPLPSNVVYRPFDELVSEGVLAKAAEVSAMTYESSLLSQPPSRGVSAASVSRTQYQSFAAQQRAQYQPATISARPIVSSRDTHDDRKADEIVTRITETAKRKVSSTNLQPKRVARSQKVLPSTCDEDERVPETQLQSQARLGSDMAHQLNQARAQRKAHEQPVLSSTLQTLSLFSPHERVDHFPGTQPDRVLRNVRAFHSELERALNSRSMANTRPAPSNPPVLVIKWVDYTNKFGLGYILSNGSVGCIFTKQATMEGDIVGEIPPSAIIVPEAERHLQSRENVNYVDYGQIIPITGGKKVEFYENNGELGISRVKVSSGQFAMEPATDGTKAAAVARSDNEYDERKRQKVILWKKFANYMIAFGRDLEYTPDPNVSDTPAKSDADVVTFYQRFGDVGCWMFCDGHFQFNFPDHTKIILSADGTWCDFYHLPLEAARDLAQTSTLPHDALDDRQKLSYPLQTLLNFTVKPNTARSRAGSSRVQKPVIDPVLQGVPAANDFRRKVEFIKRIVGEWLSNEGIGRSDMSVEGRLRWNGYRDVNVKAPFKHVWATVGARGRDERRVAWFDPKKASEIVPDIES